MHLSIHPPSIQVVNSSMNKVTLRMISSATLKQQQAEDEKISQIVQFPNHLKNPLPWNVLDKKKKGRMQEEARVARFPKADCADIHQELGIAKNATYEEMIKATSHLMEKAEAEGDYKKKWRFKVERIESYKFN